MSMINYPALFVTLATLCMLIVHAIAPSAMLAFAAVILISLAITVGVFDYLEFHRHQDR